MEAGPRGRMREHATPASYQSPELLRAHLVKGAVRHPGLVLIAGMHRNRQLRQHRIPSGVKSLARLGVVHLQQGEARVEAAGVRPCRGTLQGARHHGDIVSSLPQGSGQITHHLRGAPSRVEDDAHQDSNSPSALRGWLQNYSTPRRRSPPAIALAGPRLGGGISARPSAAPLYLSTLRNTNDTLVRFAYVVANYTHQM